MQTFQEVAGRLDGFYYGPIDRDTIKRRLAETASKRVRDPQSLSQCLARERRWSAVSDVAISDYAKIMIKCAGLEKQLSGEETALAADLIEALLVGLKGNNHVYSREELDGLSGKYGKASIGVAVIGDPVGLRVKYAIPPGPASEAGIRSGDIIAAIDGNSTIGLPPDQATVLFTGEEGSAIALDVKKTDGQEQHLELIRRDFDRTRAYLDYARQGDALVVTVHEFAQWTRDRLAAALQAQGDGIDVLVLDLRDNPGGSLNEAINTADLFIEKGQIVRMVGKAKNENVFYPAQPSVVVPQAKIVALVNAQTAAGSELVAAALQDHGRALVVGEKTMGLGEIRTLMMLPDKRVLGLVTAAMFRPNGSPIEKSGVTPDCILPSMDPAIVEKAIRIAREGIGSCPAGPESDKGAPELQ